MGNDNNQVVFKYFEKETCSQQTVQKMSAMGENQKITILSQDLIRRLMNTNTCESLGLEEKSRIVDQYKKIRNSGISIDQTRRIIVNGIKGYESKKRRREKEGRPLRSTAAKNRCSRLRSKLLEKSNWFKRKGNRNDNAATSKGKIKKDKKGQEQVDMLPTKSVFFVENTEEGELMSRMKELMRRLTPSLGFKIKIVERSGSSLRSKFPLSTLWEGTKCGKQDCTTCNQGGEKLPPCTRTSVLYENVCSKCNEGAGSSMELSSSSDLLYLAK